MADNNEEEYLDSLLKSMVDNIVETDVSQSYEAKEDSLEESYDSSEDDDMAMLSRMLLEDNDIPFDVDLDNLDEPQENALVEPIVEPIEDFSEDFFKELTEEEAEEISQAKSEEAPEKPSIAADEIDFLSSDFGNYMSLDDLLSEATNNDTGNIEIPAGLFSETASGESAPSVEENNESDEYDPFGGENLFDEDITGGLVNDSLDSMSDELSMKDSDFDIFADFAEIDIDSNKKNSAVNEEAVKEAVYNPPVDNSVDFEDDFQKELADILSLDDGMSLDDIPDVNLGDSLSQDELNKISEISEEHVEETSASQDEEVEEEKPKKKKKEKKPKKEKVKKEKAKKEKAPKDKKKFSFKEFFSKFNDEDEDSAKATDSNQELIDKLYKDKDSLDDEDPNSGKSSKKKEKKKKEKKPKKTKAPKPKKEKVETPDEKIQIGNIGVAIIAVLILVFLFGGFFGVQFIHYKLTIREAKNYFEVGNYDMAYDQISGIDIKSGDEEFYNQVRIVMIVYQGFESYNNYIELDNEVAAIDALINAVGRKQHIENQVIKYGVEDEVNKIYNQILNILEYYDVSENYAIELYRMEDYEDYYEILEELEPVISEDDK